LKFSSRKKRGLLIFFKEFISLTNQSAKHFQRTGPKDIAYTPRRIAAKFFSVKTSPLIAAMLQSQMVTSAAQFPSDSPALQSIENSFQSLPFYFSLVKPEMLLGRGSGFSIHCRRRQINCKIHTRGCRNKQKSKFKKGDKNITGCCWLICHSRQWKLLMCKNVAAAVVVVV